jgi:DNA replication protein DnaC
MIDSIEVEGVCIECKKPYKAIVYKLLKTELKLDGNRCPECRKKYVEAQEVIEATNRLLEIAKTKREWRTQSGIPPLFMNKTFDTYEKEAQPSAYQKCVTYAENFDPYNPLGYKSLVLYSDDTWGVGKTHLVTSIIHKVIDKWDGTTPIGCPCLFLSEPTLFRRIQATYNYNDADKEAYPSEEQIIRSLTITPLLVIDDVGKEQRADARFVQRTLFNIVNERYNRALPMVMTTNLSSNGLEWYLGGAGTNEATFERILEMCGGEFVRLKGKSYRRKE